MATIDTETVIVQGEDVALDLLLWRRFKTHRAGLVERVLDMNVGLADLGPILPVGTSVVIPIDAPDETPPTRPVVRLWS